MSDAFESQSNLTEAVGPRHQANRFSLPFDWDHHFVWSKDGTKCLGACALMTIRYWGVQLPDETCQEVLSRLTVPAFRGANLGQILQVVKEVLGETSEFSDEDPLQTKVEDFAASIKLTASESEATSVSLQQDVYHAKGISSLKEAFRPTKPIPQIVIYDDFMAEYNEEGSAGHACIIEGLNFDTKFVYLIDPKAQKRKKAGYLSFDDFEKGWRVFEQTTIMIYPAAFYLAHRNITNTLGMREK